MRIQAREPRIEAGLNPRALREPLGVHAIARAIDVAAGDALVGLHEVEAPARKLRADGGGEARVAPPASEVERVDDDRAAVVVGPVPRHDRERYAFALQRGDRALHEALGA